MSLAVEVKRAVRSEILANIMAKERQLTESLARERIAKLQAALDDIADTKGQTECPLKHTFTPGIYAREIFVPAGTIVVTKIHKHEHPVFVLKGECTVYSNDGTLKRVKAPCMMVTPAGTKRAVYVHTDTIWVTVHANPDNETDLQKLEYALIAKHYDALPDAARKIEGEQPWLG
jgi:quercetin dioxygenase-like cupin family protein